MAIQSNPGEWLPVRNEDTCFIDVEKLNGVASPKAYGTMLGQAVFKGRILSAFDKALANARNEQEPLRVMLTVEDSLLRRLHWERLCAPVDDQWDFISLHHETPFSLYLPSQTDRRFPAITQADLRGLILVAGPEDLAVKWDVDPFDIRQTVQDLRTAFGPIQCEVLSSAEGSAGPPTLSALCRKLTAETFTILHIVCHGRYSSREDDTLLLLPGNDGHPVKSSEFINSLENIHGLRGLPQFAFLMACESASVEAEQDLGGFGQNLVRRLGMPAVLAMTASISISTANRLAQDFYPRLWTHGEVDRALSEALAGLMEEADVTVPAIFSRLGGRPLFSIDSDQPLRTANILHGLERLQDAVSKYAPTLAAEVQGLAERLRENLAAAEPDSTALLKREEALEEASTISQTVVELSFEALARDLPIPKIDTRCPFPGLAPFRPEQQDFFFGREALVDQIAGRLAGHPFLAVVGASGSGKSSVIAVGLAPYWRSAYPQDRIVTFSPGSQPIRQLEAALAGPEFPGLLVVDQFEELFTQCRAEEERENFIERLFHLPAANPCRLVIVMRADFLGDCARFQQLRDELENNQVLVAPLNSAELRRVIEQQAARAGLRFEEELAQAILDDVSGEPGAMPLLQHALSLLWENRHGRWLLSEEYFKFGKVQKAIAWKADQVFKTLPDDDRQRARDIFLRLTNVENYSLAGETGRETRRKVTIDELIPTGSGSERTRELINILVDARLLVTNKSAVTGQVEVEVTHEALIHHWPLLRGWLDEDRTGLRLRESIRDAALEWQAAGQQDHSLLVHKGMRLEAVGQMIADGRFRPNQLERAYCDACLADENKTRLAVERRRRIIIAASLGVAIIMTGLAFFGIRQWQRADTQLGISNQRGTQVAIEASNARAAQQTAESQAQVSLSRQLAAQAQEVSALNPNRAVLLAIESWLISPQAASSLTLSTTIDRLPNLTRRITHPGKVVAVAVSADNRYIASAGLDGTARVWDLATGQEVQRFRHTAAVNGLAFSADGSLLITGSEDATARVWDVETGDQLSVVNHSGPVRAVAFNPDATLALAAGAGPEIQTWQPISGRKGASYFHNLNVITASFSPDGRQIVSGSEDFTARIWDVRAGTQERVFTVQGYSMACVFSPDQKTVAVSGGKRIFLYDLRSGRLLTQMAHDSDIYQLRYSPDGSLLASASEDRTVRVWSTANGIEQALLVHDAPVHALEFSPDGSWIASGGEDNLARIWNSSTGLEVARMKHAYAVTDVAFTPHGDALVSSGADESILVWEPWSGKSIFTGNHQEYATGASLSPDGSRVVSGGGDGLVNIWEVASGEKMKEIYHGAPVFAVDFSPSGDQVASGGQEGAAKVWDAGTGKLVAQSFHDGAVVSVRFSQDGKAILSAGGRLVQVWNIADEKEVHVFFHKEEVTGAVFSPDGRRILTASKDGQVYIWNAFDYQQENVLFHNNPVLSLAVSPDNRFAATGTEAGMVTIWDLSTNQKVRLLKHENAIPSVAFSPDGEWLVSTSGDGLVRVWRIETGEPVAQMAHPAGATDASFGPLGDTVLSSGVDTVVRVWKWRAEDLVQIACARLDQDLTPEEWTQVLGKAAYLPVCPGLP